MVLLGAGCAHPKPGTNSTTTKPSKVVIQPDLRRAGRIQLVNAQGRFAVMVFLDGQVPAADAHLSVYRNGLKVGEIKVTGPQRGNDTVGDVIAGDVQVHDEVREE